jgi:hypothetical protein
LFASIKDIKVSDVDDNVTQQLDFTLFKKTMLFTNEKIGSTTIQLHNSS